MKCVYYYIYITLLYHIVLYCIVLYYIVLYCIVLYCIILYYIIFHYIVLCYIVLYYIVLYYIILNVNIQFFLNEIFQFVERNFTRPSLESESRFDREHHFEPPIGLHWKSFRWNDYGHTRFQNIRWNRCAASAFGFIHQVLSEQCQRGFRTFPPAAHIGIHFETFQTKTRWCPADLKFNRETSHVKNREREREGKREDFAERNRCYRVFFSAESHCFDSWNDPASRELRRVRSALIKLN